MPSITNFGDDRTTHSEWAVNLANMGFELPVAPLPQGSYVPAVRSGDFVYTSGQLPLEAGEIKHKGKVGTDVSMSDATSAAKTCTLNALSAINHLVGLDSVVRVVKVVGFVASTADFSGQPQVVNGASDLLARIFGDAGTHARSAVGVAALPLNAPVEIELIVEIGSAEAELVTQTQFS